MPKNQSHSITENVILEVADELDEDPAELDPLSKVIDPEALNKIVEAESVEISFEYAGFHVEVSGINEIGVTPL